MISKIDRRHFLWHMSTWWVQVQFHLWILQRLFLLTSASRQVPQRRVPKRTRNIRKSIRNRTSTAKSHENDRDHVHIHDDELPIVKTVVQLNQSLPSEVPSRRNVITVVVDRGKDIVRVGIRLFSSSRSNYDTENSLNVKLRK